MFTWGGSLIPLTAKHVPSHVSWDKTNVLLFNPEEDED
jgi:hypothetical protein